MPLTQLQKSRIENAKHAGSAELAVPLNDEICSYLVGIIVQDLSLQAFFPELPQRLPDFFYDGSLESLNVPDTDFWLLIERLVELNQDADSYFICLASLHKRRLKYERILRHQAFPTMEQVGHRGLLQYGKCSPQALAGLIAWRKWIYDIDNRAAQETGYVFEPILAQAIGGAAFSALNSPVRRASGSERRQVDCIRDQKAYEFKLRVTIAASGQGRWREELNFPRDARLSGFTPVLIVFDATPNLKLTELCNAFLTENGEVYAGQDAWDHLASLTGETLSIFLEKYLLAPIQSILTDAPVDKLPRIMFTLNAENIQVIVGNEEVTIPRSANEDEEIGGENDLESSQQFVE